MFSRFFIDRPIFASVISILITLAGAIAAVQLPIAQYPPVAPPTIQVECRYPGASAQVVAETIASPIEQQVNGVEDMLYMASQSTADGSYTLTVTFKPGVDLNLAQVMVQNRVALAMPQLPDVVRQTGVITKKRSPDILLVVSLNSPSGRYDQLYLSNYAVLRVQEELARLPGISEVLVFGKRDYSMRIWVDPNKLAAKNLSASDVVASLREQNVSISLGQIGQPPSLEGQALQRPLSTQGRLTHPEEFAEMIIHKAADGRLVRVKDIGRVVLGSNSEDIENRFNARPTVGLAIFQLPDANALETADIVKAKIEELSKDFPEGIQYDMPYDTTPFIRESIDEVVKALRDAVILVALVVLVFLQGWRAAIIPLIAVPVAIIGTFAAMAMVGFSVNNLTLFGLVLAIGIVVDDAIVVVESVEHHIERGATPRDAAIKAMEEVSGPVIAVGLVLSAVFIPCAFMSGIVGAFYRQFALTIAISTILSTINSLTLSPALAAKLLRARDAKRDPLTWLFDTLFGRFFNFFNCSFYRCTQGYVWSVRRLLRVPMLVLVVYGGLLGLTYWGLHQLPTGFIPSQDKGYIVASLQLPDSASAERTREVMIRIVKEALDTPGVKAVNSVAGNSFALSAYGSNFGSMFINLAPFEERREPHLHSEHIVGELRKRFGRHFPEAQVNVFPPPAVSGLGRAGGFKLMIEDRGNVGLKTLQTQTDNIVELGNKQKGLTQLSTVFKANSPQLFVDLDREKCIQHGVNLGEAFLTLQAYLGSRYVNDFNRFGRTWQVIVQAEPDQRSQVEDMKNLKVRNRSGQMVPLASIVDVKEVSSPLVLTRYNMYPAAAITGNVSGGFSTGQGMDLLDEMTRKELPSNMASEWTELAFLEQMAGSSSGLIFGFSVVFVFLMLAALYESWSLPLAVILVVPMCVLSSLVGVSMAKHDINIFTQIGFIVLIGLASKNAILIVEFAKAQRDKGVDRVQATLEACSLRLRPIMMTSFAFILGVLPLVVTHGAGAEMRRALGTTVFSGMIGVTFFGILLTPVFFYVIDSLSERPAFQTSRFARYSNFFLGLLSLGLLRRRGRAMIRATGVEAARVSEDASPMSVIRVSDGQSTALPTSAAAISTPIPPSVEKTSDEPMPATMPAPTASDVAPTTSPSCEKCLGEHAEPVAANGCEGDSNPSSARKEIQAANGTGKEHDTPAPPPPASQSKPNGSSATKGTTATNGASPIHKDAEPSHPKPKQQSASTNGKKKPTKASASNGTHSNPHNGSDNPDGNGSHGNGNHNGHGKRQGGGNDHGHSNGHGGKGVHQDDLSHPDDLPAQSKG